MKIKCPNPLCGSENLDQGISGDILCHNPECRWTSVIRKKMPDFFMNMTEVDDYIIKQEGHEGRRFSY